jgi:sodium/hydrogen antiporter
VEWTLATIALAVLGVAAVSGRLSGGPVTATMLFVGVGILAGPRILDTVDVPSYGAVVRTLAEGTLTLVLFADASRINMPALRRGYGLPVRLLGIGLPLTIAAGALAAVVVLPDLSLSEALVLAVLLAPTDAALGQAVVTEPRLPIRVRQGLNVESGLNDGICVPLLLIVLAHADVQAHAESSQRAVTVVLEAVGYGLLGGLVAGAAAALVVTVAARRGLVTPSWLQIVPVAAAALAYGIATPLEGSGFIAAFVAGLTFRSLLGRDPGPIAQFNEQLGELLNGVTFLSFGAVLLGPALADLSWRVALYAVLSLTAVRMVPVALALLGTGARRPTAAFIGWFGPRGLASIVFAVLIVEESKLAHQSTMLLATYATVGLSVFLHGLSAAPLARRYARWYEAHPRDRRPIMESQPVVHQRPRGPLPPPEAQAST